MPGFLNVGLNHYLALSALLFCIGLYGALSKRNAITILMSLEVMLNAVNITLVAFSSYVTPTLVTGQIFVLFIMTVAAAEIAVGLAIVISLYRNRVTVDAEQMDLMKG